jgi:hypothetical protein
MSEVSSGAAGAPRSGRVARESAVQRSVGLARYLILLAALISFVISVSLWFSGNEQEGIYVGIWVPTIISLGAFLAPRRADR